MTDAPGVPLCAAVSPVLLRPGDPPAVAVIEGAAESRVLLLCDHAANAVPAALGDLGLPADAFGRHIAYDIGAAAVTQLLAEALGAPAIMSGFSRLVVDCNRALDDFTLMPAESDGTEVPANCGLSAAAVQARLEACFWPYHRAVGQHLDRFSALEIAPAIVAIHSFTPVMNGFARPWHLGVLWDDDPRLPMPLLEHLGCLPDLIVGDNEPYSARDPHGFTMQHHAEARGLPHVLIEIRQDEIATDAGARRYADLLAEALTAVLDDEILVPRLR